MNLIDRKKCIFETFCAMNFVKAKGAPEICLVYGIDAVIERTAQA